MTVHGGPGAGALRRAGLAVHLAEENQETHQSWPQSKGRGRRCNKRVQDSHDCGKIDPGEISIRERCFFRGVQLALKSQEVTKLSVSFSLVVERCLFKKNLFL